MAKPKYSSELVIRVAKKSSFVKRETRYVSKLVVHVADAAALVEMMRYDSCFPSSEAEAHRVIRLIGHAESLQGDDHIVRLTRVALNDNPPTMERWKSFACHVLDVRHPEEAPMSDEEAKHLAELSQKTGWSYGD